MLEQLRPYEIRELSESERAHTAKFIKDGMSIFRMYHLLRISMNEVMEIWRNLEYYLKIYESLGIVLPINTNALKLTSLQVFIIRDRWASGQYSQIELMKFGSISKSWLKDIIHRRGWKDIPLTPNEIKRGWGYETT